MSLYRTRYAVKSWVDAPTVVVTVSWIAIWLLFLSVDDMYMYSEEQPQCKVVFVHSGAGDINNYRDPAFLPSPSYPGLDDVDLLGQIPQRERARSHLLVRDEMNESAYVAEMSDRLRRKADDDVRKKGYSARWQEQNESASAVVAYVKPLRVEPSDELVRNSFYVPNLAMQNVLKEEGAWEVTAQIEFNDKGEVEYVFLLSPAKDKGINSKVERMLYQSEMNATGQRGNGIVVVSFRGE